MSSPYWNQLELPLEETTAIIEETLADLDVAPPPAPRDEAERVAQLLAEYPVLLPRGCRCERPLVIVDIYGGSSTCWKCGHLPSRRPQKVQQSGIAPAGTARQGAPVEGARQCRSGPRAAPPASDDEDRCR